MNDTFAEFLSRNGVEDIDMSKVEMYDFVYWLEQAYWSGYVKGQLLGYEDGYRDGKESFYN